VACRLLGVMALQGAGVAKDVERGKQLLTRACDAKDDEACRLLKLANDPAAADAGVPNALPGDASAPNLLPDAAGDGSDRGSSAPH
jgi:TPR repeat protein